MQDEQPAPAGVEKIIIEDVKKPAPADSTPDPSVFSEAWGILKISLAVFVAVSAYVMMKITDSAVLGHVSTDALAGSSLSDLYTTSTAFLISGGVLTTFCSQAFGAGNKKLVGIWLQVSLVVLGGMGVIVMASWLLTGVVLSAFHERGIVHKYATQYAQILTIAIPGRILQQQLGAYLQAQRIMTPAVTVSILATIVNLLLNLFIVFGTGIKGWDGLGFIGCPIVTTISQYFAVGFLVGVFFLWKGVHRDTWPGWAINRNVTMARVKTYLRMYIPAVLLYGSEFWRFNLIGVLAATLGDDQLAAFNASYKVIYLVHQFGMSLGIGTNIRVGGHLGAGKEALARKCSWTGLVLSNGIALLLAIVVYAIPSYAAKIFSSDPKIIDIFTNCSPYLALTIFFMSASDSLEQIVMAQGRTTEVSITTAIASWVVHVPVSYLLVYKWRKNMQGLYLGTGIGYAALWLMVVWLLWRSKWANMAADARKRSEMPPAVTAEPDEGTALLEASSFAGGDKQAANPTDK